MSKDSSLNQNSFKQGSLFDQNTLDNLLRLPLTPTDECKYKFRATIDSIIKPNAAKKDKYKEIFNSKLTPSLLKDFVDDYNSQKSPKLNKNAVIPALKSLSLYAGKEDYADVNFGDLATLYLSISTFFPQDLLCTTNGINKFRFHNGLERYGFSQHKILISYAKNHFDLK